VEYNKAKCRARVHTANDKIIQEFGEHNHEKRIAETQPKTILTQMKDREENNIETPQHVLADITIGLLAAVAAKLPPESRSLNAQFKGRDKKLHPITMSHKSFRIGHSE
jgi:hypothetical protein